MSRISIKKIGGVSFLYLDEESLLINVLDIVRFHTTKVNFGYKIECNVFLHTGDKIFEFKDYKISEFFDLEAPQKEEETKEDVLSINVEDIDDIICKAPDWVMLSVRCLNVFRSEGIKTVGDLVKKTKGELLRTPNFGRKSLNEVKKVLDKFGLRLKDD